MHIYGWAMSNEGGMRNVAAFSSVAVFHFICHHLVILLHLSKVRWLVFHVVVLDDCVLFSFSLLLSSTYNCRSISLFCMVCSD